MRPVEKWRTGSEGKTHFDPWTDANSVDGNLRENIGYYCSYCETNKESLRVEHILPKGSNKRSANYLSRAFDWTNFLLACEHCNSNKKEKYPSKFLPHKNNTFLCFTYGDRGHVSINISLTAKTEIDAAKKLCQMIGLDRLPGNKKYSPKDDRWKFRLETWNIANDTLTEYTKQRVTISTIINLAKASGNWSVWMSVFENHPEVRMALIDPANFSGTASCFDASGNPLRRNVTEI